MNLRADCQRLVTAAMETANTWFSCTQHEPFLRFRKERIRRFTLMVPSCAFAPTSPLQVLSLGPGQTAGNCPQADQSVANGKTLSARVLPPSALYGPFPIPGPRVRSATRARPPTVVLQTQEMLGPRFSKSTDEYQRAFCRPPVRPPPRLPES